MATITIKLDQEEARLLWLNIDGWMDAGACEGGLEPAEERALQKACDQLVEQLEKLKKKSAQKEPSP
jgi:hypothetical protein